MYGYVLVMSAKLQPQIDSLVQNWHVFITLAMEIGWFSTKPLQVWIPIFSCFQVKGSAIIWALNVCRTSGFSISCAKHYDTVEIIGHKTTINIIFLSLKVLNEYFWQNASFMNRVLASASVKPYYIKIFFFHYMHFFMIKSSLRHMLPNQLVHKII